MECNHPHHKFVIGVLDTIAAEKKKRLSKVKNLFSVKQDMKITYRFWDIVNGQYSKHQFVEVWRCHGCGKFGMDKANSDEQYQQFLKSFKHQAK